MPNVEHGLDLRTVRDVFEEHPIANRLAVVGGAVLAAATALVIGEYVEHHWEEKKEKLHEAVQNVKATLRGHIYERSDG